MTVDTIAPINKDFNYSVSDQDSSDCRFKLIAYNDFGIGEASHVGVSSGLYIVDLFAPTLSFAEIQWSGFLQVGI